MMLCRADFEELFPDLFGPVKADPGQCEDGGGRSHCVLVPLQMPSPLLLGASTPTRLPTGPVQVASTSPKRAGTARVRPSGDSQRATIYTA